MELYIPWFSLVLRVSIHFLPMNTLGVRPVSFTQGVKDCHPSGKSVCLEWQEQFSDSVTWDHTPCVSSPVLLSQPIIQVTAQMHIPRSNLTKERKRVPCSKAPNARTTDTLASLCCSPEKGSWASGRAEQSPASSCQPSHSKVADVVPWGGRRAAGLAQLSLCHGHVVSTSLACLHSQICVLAPPT